MREQLIQYVNLLFAGSPEAWEMRQEILQNTLDRYDDLIAQGKAPEAAYRLAISGIGDIHEVLGSATIPNSPAPAFPSAAEQKHPAVKNTKLLRAIAIGMYICCVIPLFVLGDVGNGVLGLCLMFLMIAAATMLIIMASSDDKEAEDKKEDADHDEPKTELGKAVESAWGIGTLVIYLGISFWTGAWYITWLIFPIAGALKGLAKACLDLKGEKKHET
jgi:hypothetical protein